MSGAELDFDARYTVAEYGGITWYLLGYVKVRDEDYDWTGLEEEDREHVRAVMVGDDSVFTFDVDELAAIGEDDYCHECGQIGCTADGRDRT